MKPWLCGLLLLACTKLPALELASLSQVRLQGGPLLAAEQTNLRYLLALEPERLLAPLKREAGLPLASPSYGNWENTGLDGHMLGHYLSALVLMLASTDDPLVRQRLDLVLNELVKIQQANGNGYLGGVPGSKALWQQVQQGKIDADFFSLNKSWVPFYNIHKTFAGLRDVLIHTGDDRAKSLLSQFGQWLQQLTKDLTEAQLQQLLLTEHGGMNEVLADMSVLLQDPAYLTLAERFTEQRIVQPLLQQQDQLTGLHANTQIPKIVGIARIAQLTGRTDYLSAAQYFFDLVVHERTVVIGGNSVREHFHDKNDFSPMLNEVEGPETCNSYNMMKLALLLYLQTQELRYLDYYERTLLNHILASQHPEHGGLVYFTPMRPQHYRVYSKVDQSMWCCVGSGIESHSKHAEAIYSLDPAYVAVNLLAPSSLNSPQLQLTQFTEFPQSSHSHIRIDADTTVALKIRHPGWVAAGQLKISRNGQPLVVQSQPRQYLTLSGPWQKGDRIEIDWPMQLSLEVMPKQPDYYAVLYGPMALAKKSQPFAGERLQLIGDDSRMGHIASGQSCPLSAAPLHIGDPQGFLQSIQPVKGQTLTFDTQALTGGPARLIPFFRLHDSRYQLYFQQLSPEQAKAQQQAQREADAKAQQLAAATLDKVYPGEQQPESDHYYQGEQSEAGVNSNRHWRHSHSWFSYQLATQGETAAVLQLDYYGLDQNRQFELWIDDHKLADVSLSGTGQANWYSVDYPIPADWLRGHRTIRLKFVAKPGSIAGGIYGVRLLRAPRSD
ncbi:beta-L-arabinofuranosidase domain-containing protein [Rheinheimera marina]|uniref:Beta-L-arabinofuranosidase domain-containing protein n=1 Tax=Rheinheimera marina TaxID=1774958 RepID=A0ABV9JNL3_9GAMM